MQAVSIQRQASDPRLRSVVAAYQSRTAALTGEGLRVPLPARTDVILEFYFTTPHLVEVQSTGERERAPWSVAVGLQTFRRVDLILAGRVEVFTVRFQPTGLHRLFGVPMDRLADVALEAGHLFGPAQARRLHERLHEASSLTRRAAVMDEVLLGRIGLRGADGPSAVALAAARLRLTYGGAALSELEAAAGLSARQFRRAFKAQVGASPKLYARILRLNAAIEAKQADPAVTWTDIAHRFGWFDQAHLDKDFATLAGDSPTGLFRRMPPVEGRSLLAARPFRLR